MAIAKTSGISLRVGRAGSTRLAWAFAISFGLHLIFYGGYEAGKKFGIWEHLKMPAWIQRAKLISALIPRKPNPAEIQERVTEVPLVFVDVNPSVASVEAPKEAKFYSDKNSKAANPDPDKDTNIPKISGKQTDIVKTEDVPRSQAFPLQPTPPSEPAKEEQEEMKQKPTYTPGDLAIAKPTDKLQIKPGDAPVERPRTIKEALARQPNSQLSGEKMKQDGGVKHHHIASSLDARATEFGAYDARFIAAVQNRWYYLLDNRNFAGDQAGRVTLRFHLKPDGSVSQLDIVEKSVDLPLALLCQSAIRDNAPYDPWPSDMRRKIGDDREVTFTFFYY